MTSALLTQLPLESGEVRREILEDHDDLERDINAGQLL